MQTAFVQNFLRERGEPIPPAESLEVAKSIKEQFSYVCPDIVKEFAKYDGITIPGVTKAKKEEGEEEEKSYFKVFEKLNDVTKKPYKVDVGYERFLGPEIFFNPEIFSSDFLTPLPEIVDSVIQSCPIDVRRGLYKVCDVKLFKQHASGF